MIKRTIKETIKEFDEKGNLIREVVTETEETEEDRNYITTLPPISTFPCYPSSQPINIPNSSTIKQVTWYSNQNQ